MKSAGPIPVSLRVAMLSRGIKAGQLARLAGLRPKAVYNLLSGHLHSWPPRAAINKALGEQIFIEPTRGKPGRPRRLLPTATTQQMQHEDRKS